jgi:multicomponent Na+:H+ antiporter subunit B
MMEMLLNAALLTLLAVVTVAIVGQRSLFGAVMLFSIYSFLMASLFIALDAPDVAMTEAAVGAGVSTVLLLATLHATKSREYPMPRTVVLPLFVSAVVGVGLVVGTYTLPPFGAADSPIHKHVAPHFLKNAYKETKSPNVVTAVLADYRGFDTFGEVVVVFTGGIGVMMLLRGRRKRKDGTKEGGVA